MPLLLVVLLRNWEKILQSFTVFVEGHELHGKLQAELTLSVLSQR